VSQVTATVEHAGVASIAEPAGSRDSSSHDVRARSIVFGIAVAMLPLITPRGPGNLSLTDVAIAAAVGLVLLTAATQRTPLRVPYVVGVGLMVLGGALASLTTGASLGSVLPLVQDVEMLVWCAAVAHACRDPRVLRVVLHTWAGTATVYAALVCIGLSTGIDVLAGRSDTYGFRASFTLGDPNVSGNYFLISLFLLRACQWPSRRPSRWSMCALLATAVVLSGSNGAVIGLLGGTVVAALLGLRRERGVVAATAAGAATGLCALLLVLNVDPGAVRERAADSVPVLRDGIGRSAQSSQERETLASESLRLWLEGSPLGLGPGQTKTALVRAQAPYVKEAHNDYVASMVERGLVGGLGLILLMGTVATRTTRAAMNPLHEDFARIVPRPELLVAAASALAVAGLFYEVLHFRHLWALLGVIAALDLWGRRS
jgi:hypothetical protein